MASLSKINVLFSVDMKQFSTDMQNSIRESEKWAKKWEASGKSMSLYVTAPLVAAGAASLKFASDFSESQNKVDVAFKDSSAQVEAFGKTTLETYGIAEGTALDMAALFGDMATSMGLPEKQAAKMSTSLVGLAGDLASFKNIGIAQATTALNGVFTGETESLKMLGIVMTEANLQQFALSQGIKKSLKDFTQAEKVQLRYAYVMQQTTNAQGDFARTGGGAANQARVFQEGLKEISVQIGNVLLPAFTSVLKKGNEFISWVADASEGQNQFAVYTALVVASIGPLLIGLSKGVQGYNSLRQSALDAYTVLAANPYTALAVAIGAIATVSILSISRLNSLTDATAEYDKVMQGATDSIAKEKSELERNLAIAGNKLQSDENRKAAIQAINAISPEYLGNLKLETLNTNEAKDAIAKYNEMLLKRAQTQAATEKLVQVEKKLLDLQLANLDAVKPNVWQNLGNMYKTIGINGQFAAQTGVTIAKNLKAETDSLTVLRQNLQSFINDNKSVVESQNAVAGATDALNGVIDNSLNSGTITYYEKQISELKKLQNEVSKTSKSYGGYQDAIDALQKKIDTIKGVRVPVTFVLEGVEAPKLDLSAEKQHIDFLDAEIDRYTRAAKAYGAADEQYKNITATVERLQKLSDNAKSGNPIPWVDTVKQIPPALDAAGNSMADLILKQQQMQAVAEGVSDGFANAFDNMSSRFLDSLSAADDGLQGFFKGLAAVVLKIISTMLAQSIAQSIAGATASAAATGPGAIIAQPAFIAEMVGGVLAAFAAIPKFETGGLISGSSFTGDNLLIRANSGERVVNAEQQRWLEQFAQPRSAEGAVSVTLGGGFEIDGNKLRLVLDRTDSRNKRNR